MGPRLRGCTIRELERHLAANGTVVLKFWLNVSKDEPRKRFLDRIDEPDSNWKFSTKDVAERDHGDDYMRAYEEALNQTSRPFAPWYAVPADDKPFMRRTVAEIIADTLERQPLRYPPVSDEERTEMLALRKKLAEA